MEGIGIPEKGTVVSEIAQLEGLMGDPDVEAYDEVSACSLTCKVCKALSCDEINDLK